MKTKVQLSFMMFVEWFIWGAWFVPLWLWLSKSGFTAGEIGWSYACTAIAAILSPILVGSLTDRFFAAQKVLAVLMFAGAILMYFVWSWSHGRCTLPMQTLGLRLETNSGERLSRGRALRRALMAVPSALTGIGLLWAIFDRDRQALHDRLSGTRLVYVPIGKIL